MRTQKNISNSKLLFIEIIFFFFLTYRGLDFWLFFPSSLNFFVAGKIMQGAILHQSCKNKNKTDRNKEIHRSHIGNLR